MRGRSHRRRKEVYRFFSNCDETGHRCVARVSYNEWTTDGGAARLSLFRFFSGYPSIDPD